MLPLCHLQSSFGTHQQRKRPPTPPPQVNLCLLAGSAPSPAAPCPGWPVSPLYLNDIAVTPHWGQRVGSGLFGKIPTSSKHWSGGHQLPCTRAAFIQDALDTSRNPFCSAGGAHQGCARLCSQSQGSQCTTDLTQQQQQPRLLSVG